VIADSSYKQLEMFCFRF